MFLRRRFCLKCAEISSSARLRIFLPRIQSILFRFKLPDHDSIEYSQTKWAPRVQLYGNRLSRRFKTRRRSGRLQRLGRTVRNPKDDQRSENCEVCRQVTRKAPVLAGVTETAASNVESANFCRDSHEREGKNQRR